MKTIKTVLILLAIFATYTISAQVAITDDGSEAHSSAMLEVKSTNKGFLPPRMTEAERDAIANPATGLILYQTDGTAGLYQFVGTTWIPVSSTTDGSETIVTAGTNVNITGTGTAASPYVVNATGAATYAVGDFAHGGVVFYVEPCGTKGLVSAIEDQDGGSGIKWRGGSTNYNTMAKGDELYAGKMNTSIIIAVHAAKNDFDEHAALACANYTYGGFGDWYLPSLKELELMWQNRAVIDATATANGGSTFFSNFSYWSSTERIDNGNFAENILWSIGDKGGNAKDWLMRVRAVRAF
jgi:hypothetical protein